jgi:hypothetical protein
VPLLKYSGWVGGSLVAALFAANLCFSVPIARSWPSDVPLNQRINVRIHTDNKWPERVVFDTTPSMSTPDAKLEAQSNLGSSETLAQAERQPFEAFAEMTIPVRPCFRPPCSAGEAAERQTSPLVKSAPFQKRTRIAARKSLTSPNQLHKPPGRSSRARARKRAIRCAGLSRPLPSEPASALGAG